jgi:hypothetical protein
VYIHAQSGKPHKEIPISAGLISISLTFNPEGGDFPDIHTVEVFVWVTLGNDRLVQKKGALKIVGVKLAAGNYLPGFFKANGSIRKFDGGKAGFSGLVKVPPGLGTAEV